MARDNLGKRGELATLVIIGALIVAGSLFLVKNIGFGDGITGAATLELQANDIPTVSFNLPINNSNFSTQLQDLNVTVVELGALTINRVFFNLTNGSGNPEIRCGASNSGNAGDNYWNCSNFNMSTLGEGEHLIIAYGNNTGNYLNDTENITINVDRTVPIVYLAMPNNTNTTNTAPTITFNFTENLFSTASCTLYADGTLKSSNTSSRNGTETSLMNTALGEGKNNLTVSCNDSLNIGNGTILVNIDWHSPTISLLVPINNSNFTARLVQDFNVTATDQLTAIHKVGFQFENGSNPYGNGTNPTVEIDATLVNGIYNVSLNMSALAEGTRTYTVSANDTAGNTGYVYGYFDIDNSPPEVVIASPSNNTNYSTGYVNITFTVTDSITDDSRAEVQFNNGTNSFNLTASGDAGQNWNISNFDMSSLAEGARRITVFANDTVGNMNDTVSIIITVDRSGPNFTSAVNSSETFKVSSQFKANLTLEDNLTGLSHYVFSSNTTGPAADPIWMNDSAVSLSGLQYNVSTTKVIVGSRDMRVCWYYWANDTLGNSAESDKFCFVIQNTPPTLFTNFSNYTMIVSTTSTTDLTSYFADSDGDNLSYIANISTGPSGTTITIDNSSDTLTIAAGSSTGSANIYINATDSSGTVRSNNFTITIVGAPPGGSSNGGGGASTSTTTGAAATAAATTTAPATTAAATAAATTGAVATAAEAAATLSISLAVGTTTAAAATGAATTGETAAGTAATAAGTAAGGYSFNQPVAGSTTIDAIFTNNGDKIIVITSEVKEMSVFDKETKTKINSRIKEEELSKLGKTEAELTAEEREQLERKAREKAALIELLEKENVQYFPGMSSSILGTKTVADTVATKSVSGVQYSGKPIFGQLLADKIETEEDSTEITIQPGEELKTSFKIGEGISAEKKSVSIAFLAPSGEEVLIKEVEIPPSIRGAVAYVNKEEGVVDLYLVIPSDESALHNEKLEDYYLEFSLVKSGINVEKLKVPMRFSLSPLYNLLKKEKTEYNELFGPFKVKSGEGFVFGQQLKYDQQKYSGDYLVRNKVYHNEKLVAVNEEVKKLG